MKSSDDQRKPISTPRQPIIFTPLPDPSEHPYDVHKLGYDPRPDETQPHGTPIPHVNRPLPATPRLTKIARSMWWNGDPWAILRNRYEFLRHAIDHVFNADVLYLWNNIPEKDWTAMLLSSLPGEVSTRSWRLWCDKAGFNHFDIDPDWHKPLHLKDRARYFLDQKITFVSIQDFPFIEPFKKPVVSTNDTNITRPEDNLVYKLSAITSRKKIRDYIDIAQARQNLSDSLNEAVIIYLNSPVIEDSSPVELAKTLNNCPFEVEYGLDRKDAKVLWNFIDVLRSTPLTEDFIYLSQKEKRNSEYDMDI